MDGAYDRYLCNFWVKVLVHSYRLLLKIQA